MTDQVPHRKHPCNECPWRRDTEPGKFPEHRYEVLRSTSGGPGAEAPLGAPMFACHKSDEGQEQACAGWLAIAGVDHLGVRYNVAVGRLPAAALRPGKDWPELFNSYDEMAESQGKN